MVNNKIRRPMKQYKYVKEVNGRFVATHRVCGITLIRRLYEPTEGIEGMRQRIWKSIQMQKPGTKMEDIEFYENNFYFGGCVPAIDGKELLDRIINEK